MGPSVRCPLQTNRLYSCGTICPLSLTNQQTKFTWDHCWGTLLVGQGGGGDLQLLFCFTHLLGKLNCDSLALHPAAARLSPCSRQPDPVWPDSLENFLVFLLLLLLLVAFYIALFSALEQTHCAHFFLYHHKSLSSFRSSVTFDSCFNRLKRLPFYSADEETDTLCFLLHIWQWWAMTSDDLVTSQCKAQLTGVSVVAR